MQRSMIIKSIFIFSFFLSSGLNVLAQREFTWTDTSFQIGSRRIINLRYDLDGPCTVVPCYDFMENRFIYDTLVSFLKDHPMLKIEISSHLDYGKDKTINDDWSKLKTDSMKGILVSKGITADRIAAVGYGNKKQIVSEEQIEGTDKKSQWTARYKNTRIEIVITDF